MPNPNQAPALLEQPPDYSEQLTAAGQVLVAHAVETSETVENKPYEIFINPYERMEYMRFTDDLIVTLDGSAESEEKPYDAVIYLDSSARPVSWMVNQLWDFAAHKDEQGNPAPKPQAYFANIDARRTKQSLDPEQTQALHDQYPQLAQWNDTESPRQVLIVDEIAVSGDTLKVARDQLEAAFPNLDFKGYAWKDEQGVPNVQRNNVRWYERGNDRYRAVLDATEMTDKQRAEAEERGLKPAGGWLATPNPDRTSSDALRKEVERLVDDVTSGKMPYWPSRNRPIDEASELITRHNDGLSPLQFKTVREWMRRHYAPSPLANLTTTDARGPLTEKEVRGHMNERQLNEPAPVLDEASKAFLQKFNYL